MTFGACRFVYNYVLSLRQIYYKEYSIKYNTLHIEHTLHAFYTWLSIVESCALQQSTRDLDKAYANWFNSIFKKRKQNVKTPKFKKKSDKQSYRTCQMRKDIFKLLDIKNRKIIIPKIGKVTYRSGYDFSKYDVIKVCNITLKKSKTNKYFCSVCCECNKPKYISPKYEETAFDLGLKDFSILSPFLYMKCNFS